MTPLFIVALVCWGAGWVLLARLRTSGGKLRVQGLETMPSIIVPARNEETNLPTLLHSITSQSSKPLEVIVVDDDSTDHTAEVTRQFGARVVKAQPLPDGWRGKAWACHQGAAAATGRLLLFLDADTWFEPDGLGKILAAYDGGAFSVGPFHAVWRAYENLSLFFNVNMTAGTVPDGLFGQMLLVDRESYERVGGHEAVRGRILENCFLAERFRGAGIPVQGLAGQGLLSFRMYPNGLRELVEGWTKGFAAGAGQTPRGVLLLLVGWMFGLMLVPLVWVVAGNSWAWAGLYLLCAAQAGWLARRIGSFSWWAALMYPVPLVFFFIVFGRSVLRGGKQVVWKGRRIHAD